MDIRATLAQQAYQNQLTAKSPKSSGAAQDGFVQAAQEFAQTVQKGEEVATQALTTGADPHSLVTALAETKLAVETTVTVRNKVVEAYQEIMRMQI